MIGVPRNRSNQKILPRKRGRSATDLLFARHIREIQYDLSLQTVSQVSL